MQKISIEALLAIVGLAGGLLGYLYREYRNKIRPFVALTSISGSNFNVGEMIEIPKELVDVASKTKLVKDFSTNMSLGDIHERWAATVEIKTLWPELESLLEALQASTGEKFEGALSPVLGKNTFDKWIVFYLVEAGIAYDDEKRQSPVKLSYSPEAKSRDGSIWVTIDGRTRLFGHFFNRDVFNTRCEPFIQGILRLDETFLKSVFRGFQTFMTKEHKCAMQLAEPVEKLIDSYSHWIGAIYLANLGEYPLLVKSEAEIVIFEKDGGSTLNVAEKCNVAIVNSGSNGKGDMGYANSPVVVNAGADSRFVIVSKKQQSKMVNGSQIRKAFQSEKARIKVLLKIQKVGFFKNTTYKSDWFPFSAMSKNDQLD